MCSCPVATAWGHSPTCPPTCSSDSCSSPFPQGKVTSLLLPKGDSLRPTRGAHRLLPGSRGHRYLRDVPQLCHLKPETSAFWETWDYKMSEVQPLDTLLLHRINCGTNSILSNESNFSPSVITVLHRSFGSPRWKLNLSCQSFRLWTMTSWLDFHRLDNMSVRCFNKLNGLLLFPSAAFETKLIHPQQERLLVQTPQKLSFTCLILRRWKFLTAAQCNLDSVSVFSLATLFAECVFR